MSAGDWIGVGGATATLISVAVVIFLTLRYREKAAVDYRVSAARVVSVGPFSGRDRLDIRFDGEPVKDVRSIDLHVQCAGNRAIRADDFDGPFSLSLAEGMRVLANPDTSSVPSGLPVHVTLTGRRLEIAPLLLNPGDSFTVSTLVSGGGSVGSLEGRIAGVRRFADLNSAARARRKRLAASSITAGVTTLGMLLGVAIFVVTSSTGASNTDALLALKGGTTLCGTPIRGGARTTLVQLQGSNKWRAIPDSHIVALKKNAC